MNRPLRVALLSYRSKPHSGGQGIYVSNLARSLTEIGHQVTVFSGQPYPELDPGIELVKVPSLDLYREPDPFRIPRLREFRGPVDVLEFLTMATAGFPEPTTFSLRMAGLRQQLLQYDVVHDNQTLGWGSLALQRSGVALVSTIHHPITMDRRLDLQAATDWRRKVALRRWYGFLRMQQAVAKRLQHIITVSQASALDIARDFDVDPACIEVVPLGVQPEVFAEPDRPRVADRIVAMASADSPLKGVRTLLEAIAKLRTERLVELVVVGRATPGGPTAALVETLGISDAVRFVHGLSVDELVNTVGSAQIACVPSLYEGFSLPTLEAMSCGTPLVVSDAGAIPEVVGEPGLCADIVPAGDPDALAAALRSLLDDPHRRARMGAAGRHRAQTGFSWRTVAEATTTVYERAIETARGRQ